jgi:hypothetical protein
MPANASCLWAERSYSFCKERVVFKKRSRRFQSFLTLSRNSASIELCKAKEGDNLREKPIVMFEKGGHVQAKEQFLLNSDLDSILFYFPLSSSKGDQLIPKGLSPHSHG